MEELVQDEDHPRVEKYYGELGKVVLRSVQRRRKHGETKYMG